MIEPATPDDHPEIAALAVASYQEYAPLLQPDHWDAMRVSISNIAQRAKSTQFLVVRDQDAIIASVGYSPPGAADPAMFPPKMPAIMLLAVHPSARRRGLAKLLINACLERARRDQANSIGLFTSTIMTSAVALYESLGFQLDGEVPSHYGVRRVRYVLPLSAA